MKNILAFFFVLVCFGSHAQIFDITTYGAVGDGSTLNTAAIQRAIDSCASAGGGLVQIPQGQFVTGTLILRSNVTIHLLSGATILGSSSMSDYPDIRPQIRSYSDNYPQKSIFYAENQHHIGITGSGTVNGQGLSLAFLTAHSNSPMGFRFLSCTNVTYADVTLKNSAFWMMHNFNIDTLTIKNIHIINQAYGNNDGIDIDGCRNVLVDSCTADCNDDAIVLKTTAIGIVNNNIEIKNCTVATYSRALKIGTETFAATSNVYLHDCKVVFSTAGVFGSAQAGLGGINLSSVNGGSLQNILLENIHMVGIGAPIFIRLGNEGKTYNSLPVPATGYIDNVRLNNITAIAATDTTSSITGIPGFIPQHIQLTNIDITVPGGWPTLPSNFTVPENVSGQPQATIFGDTLPGAGLYCRHLDSLFMRNVCIHTLRPDGRPDIFLDDIAGLDTAAVDYCNVSNIPTIEQTPTIDIYPNPSMGSLILYCGNDLIGANIKLINAEGTVLKQINIRSSTQQIDLSDLAQGIYFIACENGRTSIKKKVVKL